MTRASRRSGVTTSWEARRPHPAAPPFQGRSKRPKRLQKRHDAAGYHPSADQESPRDRRARRGSRGRRPVCRRTEAAPENAGREPVSRARARGLERADRRARLERRRSSRQALPEGDAVACSGGSSGFATGSSSRCARSSPRRPIPATLVPEARRDVEELDGFFEFLAAEISHPGPPRGRRSLRRRRGLSRAPAHAGDARPTTPIRAASSSTRWQWRP